VNTGKLIVLKEKEKRELLEKAQKGDRNAREELVNGNLRLVLSVVQKFLNRGENPDDLFQVGCIGLIKAIDNFDINQNVRFSTYGVPMIMGEIRRYLRDNNTVRVSRSLRDTAYKALGVRERLTALNSIDPSATEIAKEMGVKRQQVVEALAAIVEPVSLYDPIYNDGGDTIFVMDQIGDPKTESDWLDEISFKDAISSLSQREKNILARRFVVGRTQMEVAAEIGISQAQVSRLEKGALKQIKSKI
ncbi:MAG: RNA polymerase sporulation sigma factor SigG, partial [Oscillospiraceae bacterium]